MPADGECSQVRVMISQLSQLIRRASLDVQPMGCYRLGMASSRDVIKTLKSAGWTVVRVSGSHHTLKHPSNPMLVTVPHPEKDISPGLLRAIQRISGLRF